MSDSDRLPLEHERERGFRLGLASGVTITFALLTVFAIVLNSAVAWRMHGMLAAGHGGRDARDLVVAAALMMRGPDEDLVELIRDGGVNGAITIDARGATLRRAGAIPEEIDAARDVHTLVTLRTGRVHVAVAPRSSSGSVQLRVVAPIGSTAAPNGALIAWVSPQIFDGAVQARRLSIAYGVLNGLVVGLFGWYWMTRTVVRPVRRLSNATRAVTRGELDVRVPAAGFGEIESLARDFNRMTGTLAHKMNELQEANRSIRSVREEVIQAEKLAGVGRLAAGVAHELGNPVAAVTGYVSLLLRERDKESTERDEKDRGGEASGAERRSGESTTDADVLRRIDREMKRIDRIIRDLLEYSRPRPETVESLDVDTVAESALAIVAGQRAFQNIEVVKRLGRPPRVVGDSHRLSQVLVNLLINAADALDGATVRKIEITTSVTEFPPVAEPRRRSGEAVPEGPAVAIEVADSGMGLSRSDRERMFEPFYTTKEKGTGLGLAISRTIIESMGGRILVSGAPGAGATFRVLLPLPEDSGT